MRRVLIWVYKFWHLLRFTFLTFLWILICQKSFLFFLFFRINQKCLSVAESHTTEFFFCVRWAESPRGALIERVWIRTLHLLWRDTSVWMKWWTQWWHHKSDLLSEHDDLRFSQSTYSVDWISINRINLFHILRLLFEVLVLNSASKGKPFFLKWSFSFDTFIRFTCSASCYCKYLTAIHMTATQSGV